MEKRTKRHCKSKRQRVSDWIKEQIQPHTFYKRHTLESDTNRLKVKGWEKAYTIQRTIRENGILISNKIDFKTILLETRDMS